MAINFTNPSSILDGIKELFKLGNAGTPTVPPQLILLGGARKPGLSPSKIARNIISRKSEAGLPIGALPSGQISSDEIMETIRVEEIIKAIQDDAIITVVIPPGIPLQSTGANSGGPVSSIGSTVNLAQGYGQIQ